MTVANVQILPQQPLNTPSKGDDSSASSGRSQRNMRYTFTFFDQHVNMGKGRQFPKGRPWWGELHRAADRETMLNGKPIPDGFISQMTPGEHVVSDAGIVDRGACFASVWEAPWYPLQRYFVFNNLRSTISFNYQKMLTDEQQGRRDYWTAAGKIGTQMNVAVNPNKPPHPQIILALGEPSQMYRIAQAALAGDPWLLGFIDEPNEDLAKILKVHPLAGFSFDRYDPEVAEQAQAEQFARVQAVNAAPPSQDLLEMIAAMSAKMAAQEAKIAKLETAAKAKGRE